MRAQREHAPAARGDHSVPVECVEPLQQVAGGGQRTGGRRIDEAQGIAAPGRQLKRKRGQLDLRDFRTPLRFQPLRLRPQAIRETFRNATGAARALVGGCLRDRHHIQPREAAVRIEARLACEPAVDHHAHARQGDRRFRDIGRQHHAATAIGGGLQHAGLLFDGELAVEGEDFDVAAPFSLREKVARSAG